MFSGFYTELDISWGTIDKGDATDKGWENPDDASQLTNFSYSSVKGDDVQDYSLAVGYKIQLGESQFSIMPIAGYAQSQQNLAIGGAAITLACAFDDEGNYTHSIMLIEPLPGDSATYHAELEGAWVGLGLLYSQGRNEAIVRVQYHDYYYEGVGDWNQTGR